MFRLLSFLPFVILCSCATQRECGSVAEVQQTTSRHRLVSDDPSQDVVYLRVANDSPEAVLYAEPDRCGKIVAQLEFGQRLVVVDYNRSGYLLVRAIRHGFETEGWLWALAAQYSVPRGLDDAAEFQTPGARLGSGSPPNPRAIWALDEHEGVLAAMGGSEQLQRRFREFGTSGGLKGD
jgi:hypothetical protein